MHPHTTTNIKRVITTAKAAVRAFGRIIAATPRSMPASCININALLTHLCDFDERSYRYILKWMAYPLQNPGAKMHYALRFNGQEGTGSTLFFKHVGILLHGIYGRSVSDRHSADRLLASTTGARYLVVDNDLAKTIGDKLAHLIHADNQINVVMLSHSENFLPVNSTTRRVFAVEAPPKREDIFYQAVLEEIENGGVDAFRSYLINGIDLTDFNQFSEPPRLALTARMEIA